MRVNHAVMIFEDSSIDRGRQLILNPARLL